MIWKTILVPHDFSASATHAASIARDEAKLHRARVVLLHVIELPTQVTPDTVIVTDQTGAPVSLTQYARENAEVALADIAAQFGKDVATTTVVRFGKPVDEISKLIGEENADLVVMGTHGRSGFNRLLIGSVAERIVRSSSVPVLTVRHPEAG